MRGSGVAVGGSGRQVSGSGAASQYRWIKLAVPTKICQWKTPSWCRVFCVKFCILEYQKPYCVRNLQGNQCGNHRKTKWEVCFSWGGFGVAGDNFWSFLRSGSRIGSEFGVWQMSVCHGPPRGLGSAKITKFALRNFVAFESMDGLKFDVIWLISFELVFWFKDKFLQTSNILQLSMKSDLQWNTPVFSCFSGLVLGLR